MVEIKDEGINQSTFAKVIERGVSYDFHKIFLAKLNKKELNIYQYSEKH